MNAAMQARPMAAVPTLCLYKKCGIKSRPSFRLTVVLGSSLNKNTGIGREKSWLRDVYYEIGRG